MSLSRRQFLRRAVFACGALGAVDSLCVEPGWFDVHPVDLRPLGWGKTFAHLTDLHYRGDRARLEEIVAATNARKPDFICLTGDLMDRRNTRWLPEALDVLQRLDAPVFAVPGNHDPLDGKSIQLCRRAFAGTGGAWLLGERVEHAGIAIHGTFGVSGLSVNETKPALLLCHYPLVGDSVRANSYELILSGHSHGGQCRIPGLPPLHLPDFVGRYVEGLYQAPAGRIYVSRGLGSSVVPLRFCCRPELPVFLT